jgi:hypothetical protein
LETKGEEVTLMHIEDLILEKGKTISLEFSQIRENEDNKVFINYSHIHAIPV